MKSTRLGAGQRAGECDKIMMALNFEISFKSCPLTNFLEVLLGARMRIFVHDQCDDRIGPSDFVECGD